MVRVPTTLTQCNQTTHATLLMLFSVRNILLAILSTWLGSQCKAESVRMRLRDHAGEITHAYSLTLDLRMRRIISAMDTTLSLLHAL